MKSTTKMDPDRLQEHVLSTYHTLRYGIAGITLALPVAVYLAGLFSGADLQPSLSDYYWADKIEPYLPRVIFVGGLFAVAAFLYLYKGFTVAENIALNLASILGVGVALVPTAKEGVWDPWFVHGALAITMFLCLVYVVWFRSGDTLPFLPPDQAKGPATKMFTRAWYEAQYKLIGLVMLVSPIIAAILQLTLGHDKHAYVFFIESAAIWAFAWYWFAKSSELKRSAATRKAAQGKIAVQPNGAAKGGGPAK